MGEKTRFPHGVKSPKGTRLDTTGKRKVLVVEDAEATWTVERMSLVAAGFEPIVCTDGAAALEAIANEDFELVVLDLALPEVDGWAVLGRLRAEERTAGVPVLIVTARDDAETQQKARKPEPTAT